MLLASCRSPDVSTDSGAPIPPEPAPKVVEKIDPNDPFAPYPGSVELCNRVIIAEGRPLHWRSWVTGDDWVKVGDHYKARAKGLLANQQTDRIEFHTGTGANDRVLMIYPAAVASTKPQCNKPLDPGDKTVIMVSQQRLP